MFGISVRGVVLVGVAALVAVGGGCGSDPPQDAGTVGVVAGFYPLQFVAEQVGGDRVSVTNLAQPGTEPHDLELSPGQVASIADADLVIYVAGFQPAVDEAVKQEASGSSFDAATVVALIAERGGEKDPHLWLDPTRLAAVADALAQRLASADAAGAAGYRERAATLSDQLGQLDSEYAQALRTCQRREIVVSHAAFGYLADRYDLEQVAITGLSPETEPTPQRLAEVAGQAREHGATTIFFETLVSPRVAEAIATEVGATTAVLDPIEGLQPGTTGDYLSVMRSNLSTLREALSCT